MVATLPVAFHGRGWKVSLGVKEMNVLVAAAIGPRPPTLVTPRWRYRFFMKRCPSSFSLRRFSGLLACSLTSLVSCLPWGLWAKSLARLNSDAIVRSLP